MRIVSYAWRQISGEPVIDIINADTGSAYFYAPKTKNLKQLTLEFELTVTDNDGGVSTDTKIVTVNK